MARCGCAKNCNCTIVGATGSGFMVTGNGSSGTPYVGTLVLDPDPENQLSVGPDGLMVPDTASADLAAHEASTTDVHGIDDTADLATQDYVTNAVATLVDAAPGTLDTLNELAAALGDDANFASTVATALGTKLTSADHAGIDHGPLASVLSPTEHDALDHAALASVLSPAEHASLDHEPLASVLSPTEHGTTDHSGLTGIPDTATYGKGFVNHGSTAATARPSGFASIEWYGSVEPDNAVAGDTWVDTS